MDTLVERGQRLFEEAVFRLWVGVGVALGAALTLRWLVQPAAKSLYSERR